MVAKVGLLRQAVGFVAVAAFASACMQESASKALPIVPRPGAVRLAEFSEMAAQCIKYYPNFSALHRAFRSSGAKLAERADFESYRESYPDSLVDSFLVHEYVFGAENLNLDVSSSQVRASYGKTIGVAEDFEGYYAEFTEEFCAVSGAISDSAGAGDKALAWLKANLPADSTIVADRKHVGDYSGAFVRGGRKVEFRYESPTLGEQSHKNYCGELPKCRTWSWASFKIEFVTELGAKE